MGVFLLPENSFMCFWMIDMTINEKIIIRLQDSY